MITRNKWMAIVPSLIAQLFLLACGGTDQNAGSESDNRSKAITSAVQHAEKKTEVSPADLTNKGVGPIKAFKPGSINAQLVNEGSELFTAKCAMCHKMDRKIVGPPLKGVTSRHSPEWVLNMLLAPDKMIAEDPAAKALYEHYQTPMINQQLTEEEAKAIYDYLRKN
ncbi:c-type cytochrome [Olivibacter sp. 47]|uniref:Cytochrome c class I n=1 Tax=Sphingobacterium sp. (strain 21) TaxID=743722 RepID=F4C7H8_SPHS2|nr:cytochrome c [Olivibacter sp. 47]MDM8173020.1 cytochrome c [Olivibacter sp. 47]